MKKIVSLLLAAAITVGMTATVFAANPKITDQIAALADVDAGDMRPGTTIFVPLEQEAFDGATDPLTATDVKNSKITVKHTTKTGNKAIKSVELKEQKSPKVAGVLISMVDTYTNSKELDFELTFTLYINSKRQSYSTTVTGTLSNEEQEVYADTDYIDLSDGSMALCVENASKVEVDLGNSVSIFARMVKNKYYMGTASVDPTDSDVETFDQYPDIVNVYYLNVSGLNGTGKIVSIDEGYTFYVYDGDLNYLGTTDGLLPYSDKYFTAEKKLDVIDNSFEDEEDEFFDEEEDDFDPDNISDDALPAISGSNNKGNNPDTGASPLLGIAVAVAMLSLGAMSLTYIKKSK